MRSIGGVLLVLSIFVASSCGSSPVVSDSTTGALNAVVSAANKLQQTTGSAFTLSVTNAPYFGGSASGSGSYNFTTSQGQASVVPNGQPPEPVIFTPTVLFMNPPAATASALKLPAASPWISMDFSKPQSSQSNVVAQLATIVPGFVAFALANGAVSAGSDNSQSIPGSTHYLVTVSPARVAAAASPSSAPASTPASAAAAAFYFSATALAQAVQTVNQGALATQFEVWVDSSGWMKKVTINAIGSLVGSVTFFFTPAAAVAPPSTPASGQIVDIGTLPTISPNDTAQEVPGLDGDSS